MKLKELQKKITPFPWETGCVITSIEATPPGWNRPIQIADCHTILAADTEKERVANTNYIIHCCSRFPEVVEALGKCHEHLCDMGCDCDGENLEPNDHRDWCLLGIVERALAKAEKVEGV